MLKALPCGGRSNSIEVHLHHLRRKLKPELIRNVRGVGYRIVALQ